MIPYKRTRSLILWWLLRKRYFCPSITILSKSLHLFNTSDQIDFANTLAMIAAYGFIKLSILYYYRRLFVTRKNSIVDIVTKISIGTVIAWALVFFFRFVFYCGTHFAANWYGIYNSEAYCPTGDASNEALIISEMIANIFVICLPLPIVSRLFQ